MHISEFSIRNYQFTIVVFLLLAAIGVSAFREMPRTEDPYFPITFLSVTTVYPGADPAEIERRIIEPIEDAISDLDDVKELHSLAFDSLGLVQVEFQGDVDVGEKYEEVMREINSLKADLPSAITHQKINKVNPGLTNIVQFALVSDTATYDELASAAERLQDKLETVSGVRQSETWAYPERELSVELDLQRMAELNLKPVDVLSVVRSENTNIPGGPVDVGMRRFSLKTSGSFTSLDALRQTVIAGAAGRFIRVGDVATVRWAHAPAEYTARFNGQRAVFVTANQKDRQNIFRTQEVIDQVVAQFEPTLPKHIKLERAFTQSKNVQHRLARLGMDFSIALGLVLLTLLPLGLRAAGIVMLSIPLSLATGLSALYFTGFSLNQVSIAGFVVALGLLVDDSIVVVENITRYLRLGYTRARAAAAATKQITLAVLGCTATLMFAFLPLLMLPGNAGNFIRSLPLAVLFTVLASLFVSLTIIPFLASRVLPAQASHEGNAVLRALMGGIQRVYAPLLHWALARPALTLSLTGLLFLASLSLVPILGMSMFPKADTNQFLIRIHLPNGANLTRTDQVLRQVESELAQHPEVTQVISNLGRGNPQIYYNIFQGEHHPNTAEVFAEVKAYDAVATPRLMDELRAAFGKIPGCVIVVKELENGPPVVAPISIRLIGPDLPVLERLGEQVETLMLAQPGTQNVNNPQRHGRLDLQLRVDAQRAGLLGVHPVELDQSVRLAVAGIEAGDFKTESGDTYPIVVRAPLNQYATLDSLEGLHVASQTGAQIPLGQVAKLELTGSPDRIVRINRERAVEITAHTRSDYNTEKITEAIVQQVEQLNFPTGYHFEVAGEVKSRKESFAGFGTAILVTVFGILAILVLEFGNFKSTLIVLTVIPLGVMGGLMMLILTGFNLSFTAMVGFISLIGIEIKNSILLVDFTNQLRLQGHSVDSAVEEAGKIRFLPILLTSATAIGGLMPLALQNSGLYSPMAWVIIGGLITSTLLGRLVTPVMYKLFPPALAAPETDSI